SVHRAGAAWSQPRRGRGAPDWCAAAAPSRSPAPRRCRGPGSRLDLEPEPVAHGCQHYAMHGITVTARIDQYAAGGLGSGDVPKALAQPLVKSMVEPLETVRRISPLRRAGEPLRHRQIQDQGKIRCEVAEGEAMQRFQLRQWQAAAIALIGKRRVGE